MTSCDTFSIALDVTAFVPPALTDRVTLPRLGWVLSYLGGSHQGTHRGGVAPDRQRSQHGEHSPQREDNQMHPLTAASMCSCVVSLSAPLLP